MNAFMARALGRRKLKLGSLYTILRRMEHSGLLNSNWERKGKGLDRRIYNLTECGVEKLRQGKHMIKRQRRILEEMAEFYRLHFQDKEDT
jgi:DNA-binding PadR family transcriptional regulator